MLMMPVCRVALRILEKLDAASDTRISFAQERSMFHVLIADGACLCVPPFLNHTSAEICTSAKHT